MSLKKSEHPTISIAIPTYNEEKHLEKCLKSVFRQNYPGQLEVFVVDNYSEDKTIEIAKRFPVKIIYNRVKDAQYGKMLAFNKARGEFFIYLDADSYLRGENWFAKMLKPLLENPEMAGSLSRYYHHPDDSRLTRYLNYDPFQREPFFTFLTPPVESTIVEEKGGYFLCEFLPDRIVQEGRLLYRKKVLEKTIIAERKKFMELDNLAILVEAGFKRFAYVPEAGFYHPFLKDIKHLLKKRIRNIERNFLFQEEGRYYTYIDFKNPFHLIKIFIWIVYSTLILPSLIVGVFKAVKYRDGYCLVEPILNFVETYTIIFTLTFLVLKRIFSRASLMPRQTH